MTNALIIAKWQFFFFFSCAEFFKTKSFFPQNNRVHGVIISSYISVYTHTEQKQQSPLTNC